MGSTVETFQVFVCNRGVAYDVRVLQRLAEKLPIDCMCVSRLSSQLDDPWGDGSYTGNDVRRDHDHPEWRRVKAANLRHPIILSPDLEIADGNHRLLKAVWRAVPSILVRKFREWWHMNEAIVITDEMRKAVADVEALSELFGLHAPKAVLEAKRQGMITHDEMNRLLTCRQVVQRMGCANLVCL